MSDRSKFGVSVCSATEPTNSHLCCCGKRGGHVGEHQCYMCGNEWRDGAAVPVPEAAAVPAAVKQILDGGPAFIEAANRAMSISAATVPAAVERRCGTCAFFVRGRSRRMTFSVPGSLASTEETHQEADRCARYPKWAALDPEYGDVWHWCGEWRARP